MSACKVALLPPLFAFPLSPHLHLFISVIRHAWNGSGDRGSGKRVPCFPRAMQATAVSVLAPPSTPHLIRKRLCQLDVSRSILCIHVLANLRLFLFFSCKCSRAKATSELNASLSHLHAFLTSIQPLIEPWPVTNDPTIDSMTAYASELYPTLGLLLEMLCRNPVVTASGSSRGLAEVVAQSVIKFSARTGGSAAVGAGSKSAMTVSPSAERSWRVARMRDMFRAQQQQDGLGRKKRNCTGGSSSRHLPYSEQNRLMETKSDPFQDIFKVSDKELKEREMEQTLMTMAGNLKTLQDQVAKTELTDTAWSSLVRTSIRACVKWNDIFNDCFFITLKICCLYS